MEETEKRKIDQSAMRLIKYGWIWFTYTPERCEYLAKQVKRYCGKDIKIDPDFGSFLGKPMTRISL